MSQTSNEPNALPFSGKIFPHSGVRSCSCTCCNNCAALDLLRNFRHSRKTILMPYAYALGQANTGTGKAIALARGIATRSSDACAIAAGKWAMTLAKRRWVNALAAQSLQVQMGCAQMCRSSQYCNVVISNYVIYAGTGVLWSGLQQATVPQQRQPDNSGSERARLRILRSGEHRKGVDFSAICGH